MKIHTITSLFSVAGLAFALGAGLLTSCEKKKEPLSEKVKDALDTRPNEKIKDAAEDVRDAAKDAAKEVKDATKDAANAVKDATKP